MSSSAGKQWSVMKQQKQPQPFVQSLLHFYSCRQISRISRTHEQASKQKEIKLIL